nr:H-type small acid-soluble spore protein [Paenibacillus xylanexedens]
MNRQRAIEISESAIMKNVTYQNAPIVIQHVNEDETARIYPIGNSEQEMTVPLSSLTENP